MSLAAFLLAEFSRAERNMSVVLIVDDDSAFRAEIPALFESGSGFEACLAAENGVEPIAKAKQVPPNLAVLDFSMPEMNGLQLAQELRAIAPKLPIFLLSANGDADTKKQALASGAAAVFLKREDLTTLVDDARAVCSLEQASRSYQEFGVADPYDCVG
jgi:DNA-binding NarL/FixJ family response regulator